MSWLSSLFKKKKVSVPNTKPQEDELRRQTDALIKQLQDSMAAQNKLFTDQRAADDLRYDTQRAADLAEAERQRSILLQQLEEQRASQEEINAALEAQRAEQEAAAATKAANSRAYADGRSAIIDQVTGALDTAYAPFDNSYYQTFAEKMLAATRGGVDKQFSEDRRTARLGLANRGNLNSSAGARVLGTVQDKYRGALGEKAAGASDAAERLRGEIENSKKSALAQLVNSAFTGEANLPDGVTDVQNSLDTIASRLSNYVRETTEKVNTYVPMAGRSALVAPVVTAPKVTTSALTAPLGG